MTDRQALTDEARELLTAFRDIEANKQRGQGDYTKARRQIFEDAVGFLVRAKMPPAVTALFSALLGDVLVKSGDVDNRHAAELAAARVEASGGKVSEAARAYSHVRNVGWGRDQQERDCRTEIRRLRKRPHYQAMIARARESLK